MKNKSQHAAASLTLEKVDAFAKGADFEASPRKKQQHEPTRSRNRQGAQNCFSFFGQFCLVIRFSDCIA